MWLPVPDMELNDYRGKRFPDCLHCNEPCYSHDYLCDSCKIQAERKEELQAELLWELENANK
jgi:hypothetical protein